MNEERRRILEMLSSGKVTVDEANELLAAFEPVSVAANAASQGSDKPRARWLRLTVDKNLENGRKKEVSLKVPASLVRAGVKLGSLIPGADVGVAAGGKDGFAKIDAKEIDALLDNMGEMTIDIENGKSQVRIWCE